MKWTCPWVRMSAAQPENRLFDFSCWAFNSRWLGLGPITVVHIFFFLVSFLDLMPKSLLHNYSCLCVHVCLSFLGSNLTTCHSLFLYFDFLIEILKLGRSVFFISSVSKCPSFFNFIYPFNCLYLFNHILLHLAVKINIAMASSLVFDKFLAYF